MPPPPSSAPQHPLNLMGSPIHFAPNNYRPGPPQSPFCPNPFSLSLYPSQSPTNASNNSHTIPQSKIIAQNYQRFICCQQTQIYLFQPNHILLPLPVRPHSSATTITTLTSGGVASIQLMGSDNRDRQEERGKKKGARSKLVKWHFSSFKGPSFDDPNTTPVVSVWISHSQQSKDGNVKHVRNLYPTIQLRRIISIGPKIWPATITY